MLPRIDYIKQARIKLRLTQRDLAILAGVSTSMVNQIESGRCKPSYETARKLFEVLGSHDGKSAMKAREICTLKVIFVQKNEPLQSAIEKMRQNSISQIPVFDGSKVVGLLSEDILARSMIEQEKTNFLEMSISKMMEPPPPIVDVSTPAKALIPLVRFTKCVLVSEKGEVVGIVTVSDTLKLVE
jgi:predicted transcriptional regulator